MKTPMLPAVKLTVAMIGTIASTSLLTAVANAQAYGTPDYWIQQQNNYSRQLREQEAARQQQQALQMQQQQMQQQQQNAARQRAQQDEWNRQQQESSRRQREAQDRSWRDQQTRQYNEQQQRYNQQQQEDRNRRQRDQQAAFFYWQQNQALAQTRYASSVWGTVSKGYTDGQAWGVGQKFSPGTRTLHCSLQFDGVPPGSVQTVWMAIDVKDPKNLLSDKKKTVYRNERISEFRVGEPDVTSDSYVTVPYDWPKGKYRADIYVGGKLVLKMPYTIE